MVTSSHLNFMKHFYYRWRNKANPTKYTIEMKTKKYLKLDS